MTYQDHKQRFGITKNQLQVLNYLKEYIAENEYSPSMREVADACGPVSYTHLTLPTKA